MISKIISLSTETEHSYLNNRLIVFLHIMNWILHYIIFYIISRVGLLLLIVSVYISIQCTLYFKYKSLIAKPVSGALQSN